MNILVTTDGSERSLDVLPHVGRLATQLGSGVVLLRVLNPLTDVADEFGADFEAACAKVAHAWQGELTAFMHRFDIAGEPLVGRLQHGEDAHDAILRIAAQREASIVAMHSRGSGALRHALLGSVALGVLAKIAVPILLTGGNAGPPRTGEGYRIVATSDGSPASTRILGALSPILQGTAAKVSLLRVCEPRSGRASPEAEIETATAQLKSLLPLLPAEVAGEIRCRVCHHDEDVATAIVEGARELGADAIALSTHGESALHHLIAGSVALSVLERSPLPVILSRSSGTN